MRNRDGKTKADICKLNLRLLSVLMSEAVSFGGSQGAVIQDCHSVLPILNDTNVDVSEDINIPFLMICVRLKRLTYLQNAVYHDKLPY